MTKNERTRAYIDAMGKQLIDLLASGHKVFDGDGELVGSAEQKGFDDVWGLRYSYKDSESKCRFVIYHDNKDWDNGYHDSVTKFKRQFSEWTVIDPKHVKKLKNP